MMTKSDQMASLEMSLATAAQWLMRLTAILLPSVAVVYLLVAPDPATKLVAHGLHEVAIAISILLALFFAWVTFRCYEASGEPFMRFLALGFLGFAIVYSPHGILTRHSVHDMWSFLLYGPASRVAMTAFVLLAIIHIGRPAEPVERRRALSAWMPALVVQAAMVPLVYWLATAQPLAPQTVRVTGEWLSMALSLVSLALLPSRRLSEGVAWLLASALLLFIQSCLAFLATTAWSALWWLAHGIFAAGFFVLSYRVMRAYSTTRAFTAVFNEAEMMARLAATEARAAAAKAEEEQLRTLFAASPVGIAVVDGDGTEVFANDSQRDLMGPAGHEVTQYVIDAARRLAAAGAEGEVELPLAGGDRWLEVAATPLSFGGKPALVVWTQDITARRHAEDGLRRRLDDKEVLLAELNHRVKNNLELVSRLLALQAARSGDGNARNELDGARRRIDTLGRLHRRLYRSEYTGMLALGPALEDLCADLAAAASGSGVTIAVEAEPLLVPVEKAGTVFLLVSEMLTNCLKHAFPHGRGGTVRVRAERMGEGRVRVSVADDGVGLPVGFDGGQSGTSIGMRVVHSMAAQLGSALEAGPAGGPGSCLSVTFATAEGEMAALSGEAQATPEPPPEATGAKAPAEAAGQPHMLVVDDELLAAECIAELFERRGWRTTVAGDGNDAWRRYLADPADVVITDLRMAGMDGAALARQLLQAAPSLPIIILSGNDGSHLLAEGVAACLHKPVALEELERTVRRLVPQRAATVSG
jgi:two-component sensor histidine kinase/ActR/RegA family two-component response regulator